MRCPQCGARNTAEAPWCTQCLTPLRPLEEHVPPRRPEPEGPDADHPQPDADHPEPDADHPEPEGADADHPEPDPPEPAADPPAPAPVASSSTTGATGEDRQFRTVDGDVEWRCGRCHEWNPMVALTCTVCGAGMPGADRSGAFAPDRVARTRRTLWIVAGVICLVALLGVVMAIVSLRGS